LKHDNWKTTVARIAALRTRAVYRAEKQQVVAELTEAQRRGEAWDAALARLEADALRAELLGRQ
jgi:hypothetical protein